VATYPDLKDEQGWLKYCFGENSLAQPHVPLLTLMIQLDEVAIIRLLKLHIKWIQSPSTDWSSLRLQWLFALLVCLDLPIDASMQAELFQLQKSCKTVRATSESLDDDILAGINIVITVLEKVFNQREV